MAQEPPNRKIASFSSLCSLALSSLPASRRLHLPGFLTASDFELGIASMQSRLWEETRKFQIAGPSLLGESRLFCDEIARQHGYGQSWPGVLDLWKLTREHLVPSSQKYTSSHVAEQRAYCSSTLWYHASMLRATVDVSRLRALAFVLHGTSEIAAAIAVQRLLRQHELSIIQ